MTVIFNKRLGIIKAVFSGTNQHISTVYGAEGQDYALIFDETIVPDDNYVMKNPKQFIVNVETKQLEMLSVPNYPIVQGG
jgi:hypothetical protein